MKLLKRPIPLLNETVKQILAKSYLLEEEEEVTKEVDVKELEKIDSEIVKSLSGVENDVKSILSDLELPNTEKLESELKDEIKESLSIEQIQLFESYKKRGKLNEGILGIILSSPKIIELIGLGLDKLGGIFNIIFKKLTGKSIDNNILSKIGKGMQHFGHKTHHILMGSIEKMINVTVKALTGKELDKEKSAKVAKIVMIVTIGYLFISGSPEVIKKLLNLAPEGFMNGVLQAIKGGELIEMTKLSKIFSKIITAVLVVFGLKVAADILPDEKEKLEKDLQTIDLKVA